MTERSNLRDFLLGLETIKLSNGPTIKPIASTITNILLTPVALYKGAGYQTNHIIRALISTMVKLTEKCKVNAFILNFNIN